LRYTSAVTPTEYQQLVEFLGRQFTEVDRRFTELDGRFTEIDRRFSEVRDDVTGLRDDLAELRREMLGHFDEIYRRLDRLEQEHQAITQALRRIEAGLGDERRRREIVERDLAELKRHVATLQARIEEIEQRPGD
jgi:chromosome segregation ATPase